MSPERPATRLLGVSAKASGGGVRFRVHTDGRPGRVAVFALEDPRRLVIDLYDLRDAETPARMPVGEAEISQLRVGRHPERIRIVADAGAKLLAFEPIVTRMRDDGLEVEITFPRGDDALDRSTPSSSLLVARGVEAAAAAGPSLPRPVAERQPAQAAHGDVHLELEAAHSRVGDSIPRGMESWQRWKRELDLDSRGLSAGWSDEASAHPDRAPLGDEEQRLAALGDRESGALAHNRIRVGLLDGRLRLTTRYARSHQDPTASRFAAALGSLRGRDLDRLLDPAGVVGEAFSGRLDGTLWTLGPARVDGFASFERVDPLFAWNEKGGKGDSFSRSGRRMLEAGGAIRGGPFTLALSRISEQAEVLDLRSDRRPRRSGHRAVASASLESLRRLDAGASEHALWSLVPDSAWVSLTQARVDPDGALSDDAATRDLSAGLSWDEAGSSATLSFWRSSYEGGGSAADWSGSGADLGYGLYRDAWDLYAGLGAQRSRTDQPGYHSLESSLAGFLSVSVRPKGLLPLSTTFTVDRYAADYGASAAAFEMQSFGLRTGLDLSELLFPIQPGLRAHLRASYGAVWSRTHGGAADGLAFDHGPVVVFGFDF